MGCRCCKMIQSYLFDPQDVQSSGYVNEINNYKPDEQDGGKFKCKENDTRPHKEQLQNAELQQAANRHKLNNTKDAIQNHRSTSFHKEGLGNSVEKCNGIHAYPNPSMNQSRESDSHTSFEQLSDFSAKRLSQPHACNNHETPQKEAYPKLPSETTEHFHYEESQDTGENISCCQSATLDMQGSGTRPPESSYAKKLISTGSKSTSNHIHTDESTKCTAGTNHSIDLPLLDSRDKTSKAGLLNTCFKDKSSNDALSPQVMVNVAQEAKSGDHEGVSGDLEEEDAEVAEALAALEAATAGEDSEEEENY